MNKSSFGKGFILPLTIMSVMALSACSGANGDSNANSDSGNAAASSENTAAGNTNTSTDTAATSSGDAEELTLFINHSWYPVKDFTGPIADRITEKTGVKLKVTVATDDKQLPLMIASGDLPDLIFSASDIDRLSNANISYSWNELIEKYAPDFQIDATRIAINTMKDGNFYTIRNAFATEEEWKANQYALGNDGNPGIAVREDIMNELGNPPMKTLDDFVNILNMVKEKHPEMVPLIMDKNWIEQYFMGQFGIDTGIGNWYESEGQVNYWLKHPKAQEFFLFMNSLYRYGYILAENFAHANDQIDDEYAVGGKAFAHSHTVSVADRDNISAKKNGAAYTFKMIPSALSEEKVQVSTGIGWSGTFITKKNKNPEKSIKLMQYLASDEGKKLTMFGIEGEHWTWNEEGYPNLKYSTADSDFVNGNGIKWWFLYSDAIVEGLWGYVPGTQTTQALIETKEKTVYKPEIGLIQVQADSAEKTIKTKIDEMVTNEKVKIYLAKSEDEAAKLFENMLKTADKIGLAKLDDWANKTYAEKKALFK
ncbi:putative aldouronate transport system substrate-binding protein [Paenibacillus phyllosphaerae]|uniref:Putative aldouronate transport system substrate-binding protein n=1 Tax=Paenibacillus phyllosphaerae TaxID=274593 RepID=A0A7W5FQP9_9BACL|nr:extracellular solute-binding protein [Paenibacillus phyllosphaerae]MBB3113695.1 putative aldouronate transport system substrate-binding protein [Paenibacillus phyllosphaerae]